MIVPLPDKADDKNKKTVKKSSIVSRSKSKATDTRKADDLPENSISQDASFFGDNENDNDSNFQPPSERTRSEASVSLELVHDFLGKPDERFSVLESAIHQMPSHRKECEQANHNGSSNETAKSVIIWSKSMNLQRRLESIIIA